MYRDIKDMLEHIRMHSKYYVCGIVLGNKVQGSSISQGLQVHLVGQSTTSAQRPGGPVLPQTETPSGPREGTQGAVL